MANQERFNQIDSKHSIFKYAVLLEYDGSNYNGSQVQPRGFTVQSEIESALKIVLKNNIRVVFSGRTDTGVSANGQVLHFESEELNNIYKVIYSLNGVLPGDIAIRSIQKVDSTFHARKSAQKRWYRFSIYNNKFRSAINRKSLHVYQHLDENLLNKSLKKIEGTNNFDSFKSSNSTVICTKCTIYKAFCFRDGDFIHVDIIANRFLYNMIRIIVGTLLDIGIKTLDPTHLETVVKAQDRKIAGQTVKPDGLSLMSIEYSSKYNLFAEDKHPKVKDILQETYMEAQNEDIYSKAS